MRQSRRSIITAGLELSGLASQLRSLRPSARAGLIFTLHHVRPFDVTKAFQPNAHLEITPEFLRDVIDVLKQEGFDFIRLSDLPSRLEAHKSEAPFAIFTLDDGYRNNRDYALPIFEDYQVPATIFVTKGFAERSAILWWEVLAELIAREEELAFDFGRGIENANLKTIDEKAAYFNALCSAFWSQNEVEFVEFIGDLAKTRGIDPFKMTEDLTLSSSELTEISRHSLIELGAHSKRHLAIARLNEADAKSEIISSVDWLEALTGKKPTSFAFPYGREGAAGPRDFKLVQELGIELSVTTRPGMIRSDHITDLSALPRVSLNGYYQKRRYAQALASGIPFRWSTG